MDIHANEATRICRKTKAPFDVFAGFAGGFLLLMFVGITVYRYKQSKQGNEGHRDAPTNVPSSAVLVPGAYVTMLTLLSFGLVTAMKANVHYSLLYSCTGPDTLSGAYDLNEAMKGATHKAMNAGMLDPTLLMDFYRKNDGDVFPGPCYAFDDTMYDRHDSGMLNTLLGQAVPTDPLALEFVVSVECAWGGVVLGILSMLVFILQERSRERQSGSGGAGGGGGGGGGGGAVDTSYRAAAGATWAQQGQALPLAHADAYEPPMIEIVPTTRTRTATTRPTATVVAQLEPI